MAFELDHLFICTDIGASEADKLVSFGFVEGRSNTHPGQGTANRCFFFHNAMLEFLWVHNPAEAKSALIQRTRLWERWFDRDHVCPIGICLRPTANTDNTVAFPNWAYRPPYLPETMSIAVGTNSDILTEPMLFQTPFAKRPDRYPADKAQPLAHGIGVREITRVELISPVENNPSPELQAAIDTHQIKLRLGSEYYIELGFDREVRGQQIDFRPGLPLIVSW
jgi:Glyoxalase-like domain